MIAAGRSSPYSHDKSNYDGNVITVSASGAYAGFVQYHNSPIWASDCTVIWSKNESAVLTRYIYCCLKGKQDEIHGLKHGTGQPHVYEKDFRSFPIPRLPVEKQIEIIRACEDKEAKIKALEEEAAEQRVLLTQLMRNIFREEQP